MSISKLSTIGVLPSVSERLFAEVNQHRVVLPLKATTEDREPTRLSNQPKNELRGCAITGQSYPSYQLVKARIAAQGVV